MAITHSNGGVRFSVKVVPNSSRNAIAGLLGSSLKVNLTAVAEQGKANQALVKLLGEVLGRPKSSILICSGAKRPQKEVIVEAMTVSELEARLDGYL